MTLFKDVKRDFSSCQKILELDVSSKEHALPGLLLLYTGMPVIYRGANFSTDLHIINGAQGVVKVINTHTDNNNLTIATSALVYFPNSHVQLPNLPTGWFHILPVSWHFNVPAYKFSCGSVGSLKCIQHQLPLQPAFALTGHLAQGKTIEQVFTLLTRGVHLPMLQLHM